MIGRELVYSTWYGRWHLKWENVLFMNEFWLKQVSSCVTSLRRRRMKLQKIIAEVCLHTSNVQLISLQGFKLTEYFSSFSEIFAKSHLSNYLPSNWRNIFSKTFVKSHMSNYFPSNWRNICWKYSWNHSSHMSSYLPPIWRNILIKYSWNKTSRILVFKKQCVVQNH